MVTFVQNEKAKSGIPTPGLPSRTSLQTDASLRDGRPNETRSKIERGATVSPENERDAEKELLSRLTQPTRKGNKSK